MSRISWQTWVIHVMSLRVRDRHHQGVLLGTLQEGTQHGDAYLFGTRAHSWGPAPDLGRLICGRLQEPLKGQMWGQDFALLAS